MLETTYLIILFVMGITSLLLLVAALDRVLQATPRIHHIRKEGRWIQINTRADVSGQEGVMYARERGQESAGAPLRESLSSRAGHVPLDYTSVLERKRRRGG